MLRRRIRHILNALQIQIQRVGCITGLGLCQSPMLNIQNQ